MRTVNLQFGKNDKTLVPSGGAVCVCLRVRQCLVTAPSSVAEGNLQRPTALPDYKVGIQKAHLPHWVNLPYRDEKTLMVGKIEGRRRGQ